MIDIGWYEVGILAVDWWIIRFGTARMTETGIDVYTKGHRCKNVFTFLF